jgi:hypothetical protein
MAVVGHRLSSFLPMKFSQSVEIRLRLYTCHLSRTSRIEVQRLLRSHNISSDSVLLNSVRRYEYGDA